MALALTLALLVLYFADSKVNAYFNEVQPSHVITGILIAFGIVIIGVRRGWR